MSLDPADVSRDVSDLTADELKTLDDWVVKFEAKYPAVGHVVDDDDDAPWDDGERSGGATRELFAARRRSADPVRP